MSRLYAFSAGTARAKVSLSNGACDCHIHVYDNKVPAIVGAALNPPDASISDYQQVQQRMGTQRAVVVTPSTYGADNRLTLAAISQLGSAGRGVVVITGDETLEDLCQLNEQGVRGVRVNLSKGVIHQISDVPTLARRIAPLGWHLQLLMPVDKLLEHRELLLKLPVDLVFDHFGRITPELCGRNRAHDTLLHLLKERRAWIKLSGGYLVSSICSSNDPQLLPLARSFIDAAPDRVLWGSDWPHATASAGHQPMPDDAAQLDALASWAGNSDRLRQILVINPEKLYGFTPSSSH